MNQNSLSKSAYKCKHVESVSAYVLLLDGEYAGKIVANWSDNPNGSVCTATINIHRGELTGPSATGSAGGYGYDKLSAAVSNALYRVGIENELSGRGMSTVETWLNGRGYAVHQII